MLLSRLVASPSPTSSLATTVSLVTNRYDTISNHHIASINQSKTHARLQSITIYICTTTRRHFYYQLGIAARLQEPTAALVDVYGTTVIDALQMASLFLAGTLLLCLLPCIVVWAFRTWCVIHVVALED